MVARTVLDVSRPRSSSGFNSFLNEPHANAIPIFFDKRQQYRNSGIMRRIRFPIVTCVARHSLGSEPYYAGLSIGTFWFSTFRPSFITNRNRTSGPASAKAKHPPNLPKLASTSHRPRSSTVGSAASAASAGVAPSNGVGRSGPLSAGASSSSGGSMSALAMKRQRRTSETPAR